MVERTILEASLKKTQLEGVWTLHLRNETNAGTHVVFPVPLSTEELEGIKKKLTVGRIEEIPGKLYGGKLRIHSGNHAIIAVDGTEIPLDEGTRKTASQFAYQEPKGSFGSFAAEKEFRNVNPLKSAVSWATAQSNADESIQDIVKRVNDSEIAFTSGWSHSFLEKRQEDQYNTAQRLEERTNQRQAGASKPWDPRLIHWPVTAFPMQQAYLTLRVDSEHSQGRQLLEALKKLKIRTEAIPPSQATYQGQPNYVIRFRAGHRDITRRNEAVVQFWDKVRQALTEVGL